MKSLYFVKKKKKKFLYFLLYFKKKPLPGLEIAKIQQTFHVCSTNISNFIFNFSDDDEITVEDNDAQIEYLSEAPRYIEQLKFKVEQLKFLLSNGDGEDLER